MDTIAITMGDPAGIGPEIVLRTVVKDADENPAVEGGPPLIIGDYTVLKEASRRFGIDVSLIRVEDASDWTAVPSASSAGNGIPVLDAGIIEDMSQLATGKVSALAGRAAVAYIETAVELALRGAVKGIATGPINKMALREAGFHYIGHTEMLAEMSGSGKSVTMFMVDRMRIFFHTRHMALRDVIESLSVEGVAESIRMAQKCLESVALGGGELALAALNPHGSDDGLFGDEEELILKPAIQRVAEEGIPVHGPFPADSVFHNALQGKYSGVVSLYHDQGHIAAKTYDFHRTVSVTFGLPFMRTSVDHGTAFDIAWKGVANPVSMEEALKACRNLTKSYRPPKL